MKFLIPIFVLTFVLMFTFVLPADAVTLSNSFGSRGNGDGEFIYPEGITAYNERIYVVDTGNYRIQIFDLDGNFLNSFGDDEFIYPEGITVYNKKIYVTDTGTDKVYVFDLNGNFLNSFGDDNLVYPRDVAAYNEKIYVADTRNHKVYVFDLDGNFLNSFGDEFMYPESIIVYNKKIYVTDTGYHKVYVFDLDGNFLNSFGDDNLVYPRGITVYNKKIYVADTAYHKVYVFDLDGNFLNSFGDDNLLHPRGITAYNEKIYVADAINHRVQVFDLDIKEERKSGGGCNDCTPPTLGMDNSGNLLVKDGITINGHSEDGGYFYTDYPMQYTELNKTNNITLKYYENGGPQNISVVQLGLGIAEVGSSLSESEALIEVHMDHFSDNIENPIIKEIIVIDPKGIISNVNSTVSLVTCSERYSTNQKIVDFNLDREEFYKRLINNTCLLIDFEYSYNKVPDSTILGSNAWDYSRNVINNYFNDGLKVIDNTPQIILEEVVPEPRTCILKNIPSRNNPCQFQQLIEYEENRAEKLFSELFGVIGK